MLEQLRQIVSRVGRIDAEGIGPEVDLYDRGLTSHGTVSLMLELEDTFGVEFPDELLRRETFSSLASIAAALRQAGAEA